MLNEWSDRVPQRPLSRVQRVERHIGHVLLVVLLLLTGAGVVLSIGWSLLQAIRPLSS